MYYKDIDNYGSSLNFTVVLIKLRNRNTKRVNFTNLRKKFLNNVDFFAKNIILLKV